MVAVRGAVKPMRDILVLKNLLIFVKKFFLRRVRALQPRRLSEILLLNNSAILLGGMGAVPRRGAMLMGLRVALIIEG